MRFRPAKIPGVWLIDLDLLEDERGFLARTYCSGEFSTHHLNTTWVQCNLTLTRKRGMLRGMHFQQNPKPEIKLIRCSAGSVYDVLVDIRARSPMFGKWEAFKLSSQNRRMLYVPAGIAHGFQCLEDDCEMFYQMSEFYEPSLAAGLRWNDPAVRIPWPIKVEMVSERDRRLPFLDDLACAF
jgi:dTDP-4-dehydrorhamnose 3,5-epimerase